jgi:pimeloyl-ACP methyl ester carboxylesterase
MFRRKDRKQLWNVGLGAGLLGASLLAVRYAIRKPAKPRVPETISPAIFATKVLHTSTGQIIFHESGSGRPLVFVHGVYPGASSYEWAKVYPHFATIFRVLAPDLIGFGESQRPRAAMHAGDYVRMLAEFIRATTADEMPVLIGSGLGAGFCVYLASQHPELVSRLVLSMPTGWNDFGRHRLPFGLKLVSKAPLLNRFIYSNYQSTQSAIATWLARYAFADANAVTEEMVDVVAKCAQQYGAEHAILNFYSGRLNFDLESRIRAVTQPVTLLWGEKAPFPPLDWAYRLQPLIKRCNLAVIPSAGILPALEAPEGMIQALECELTEELRIYRAG